MHTSHSRLAQVGILFQSDRHECDNCICAFAHRLQLAVRVAVLFWRHRLHAVTGRRRFHYTVGDDGTCLAVPLLALSERHIPTGMTCFF